MIKQNNVVEKSKSLVWAKFNNYTANELKLLDVYLSRINARDSESSTVTFTKKEYCSLMGLHPDTKTQQLKKYTKRFLGNVITINVDDDGYEQYTLFTKATCKKDPEINQVTITLDCNSELKGVFFDLASDGYIRYKLQNILSLKSQYAIRLYSLLKDRAFGKYEWSCELKELRELLGATNKNNESFREFNKLLTRCQEEINDHTDIHFTYEKITRGRLTRGVKFKICENNKTVDQLDGQLSLSELDFEDSSTEKMSLTANILITEMLQGCGYKFTDKQINTLCSEARKHIPFHLLPEKWNEYIMLYIKNQVSYMEAQEGVEKPYFYLRKAVIQDYYKHTGKELDEDLLISRRRKVPVLED